MMVYSTTARLHRAVLSRPGRLGIAGSFVMSLKFGISWGAIVCKCCCIPATAPVVEGQWGVTEDEGEGCAEPRRRLTLWRCFLVREQHYLYTHRHWDYGNAEGLEHKHSPLPDPLLWATVNVKLLFSQVNWELLIFSWWSHGFTFL